jgi:signal transduction histidine kinase/DNA-binding response OmpR family regulator
MVMKNLLVWQKLALLGAVFLVPLVAVTWALISSVQSLGIASARHELLGVEDALALQKVLRDLQLLRGDAHTWDDRASGREELLRDLAAMDAADLRLRAGLQLSGEWPTLAEHCRRVLRAPDSPLARQEMGRISKDAIELLSEVADHSELTLDPELGSYYFMDVCMWKLPQHAEVLTQVWTRLASASQAAPPNAAERNDLQRLTGLIDFLQLGAEEALGKAKAAEPNCARDLRIPERGIAPVAEALATERWPAEASAWQGPMRDRLDADYVLAGKLGIVLEELLTLRINRLQHHINQSLIISAVGLLLVCALGWRLIRDITRPIGALARTATAIERGDPDATVSVEPRRDEIGRLAQAWQRMLSAQRQSRAKLMESHAQVVAANEKLQAKTDEAQRLAVEADAANRAKRDFLAVMSHEIRTPMNGIIGMTELALNTELTATQREYLEMVRSSAETLLELLNDILDFSKIEAGRLELEHTDFELRDLLGDTMQALSVRAHERGLELALQIRPDVADALTGDPHRLRQIVVNLVGNALKFTEHGEVTMLVECAERRADGIVLRFQVRDTGMGIPAAAQARIFQAFSQADSSTTRRFGGTGLGLAITHQLVTMMGGQIEVQSEEGKGSIFSFTAVFHEQPDRAPAAIPALEHLRVLAVDDNATNRLILRELFTSWAMAVEVAESAAAGLAALKGAAQSGQPFALLVTDMMMPGIDGLGLVEEVRLDPGLRNLPVIMLTSSNRFEELARSERLGIGAHLSKPVKQSRLMDAIVGLLGRSTGPRVVPPVSAVPPQRPLRILLAEDNAVNQRLAVVNLESWGHQVTVARDGCEAVEACTAERFDLVLMDSQMPRMSGFEATAEIRRREGAGNGRVPIIAMTANVMKGYREECLAAGMDGYVAKPIRRQELLKEIASVVPDFFRECAGIVPAPVSIPATPATPGPDAVFDPAALLESLGGDRATVVEMIRLCLEEDAPRLLADLRDGLETRNLAAVEHAAHGIKGLVGEFHAAGAHGAARQLEAAARGHETESVPGLAQELFDEFDRLAAALRLFVASGVPPGETRR